MNEKVSNKSDLDKAFKGQDCDDTPSGDPACAQVNEEVETAPWDYQYKCGGTAQPSECEGLTGVQDLGVIRVSTFFEGGVNVTELSGKSLCAQVGWIAIPNALGYRSRESDLRRRSRSRGAMFVFENDELGTFAGGATVEGVWTYTVHRRRTKTATDNTVSSAQPIQDLASSSEVRRTSRSV